MKIIRFEFSIKNLLIQRKMSIAFGQSSYNNKEILEDENEYTIYSQYMQNRKLINFGSHFYLF